MSAVALLQTELAAAGVALRAVDGQLRYRAPAGALTPALRAQLAEHKAELLALLAGEAGGGVGYFHGHPAAPSSPGYQVIAEVPADVAARGLEAQAKLDAAFLSLPPRMQDVPAIEAVPFWARDGAEMKALMDAGDWAGLLAAVERHEARALGFYARLQRQGEAA